MSATDDMNNNLVATGALHMLLDQSRMNGALASVDVVRNVAGDPTNQIELVFLKSPYLITIERVTT